MRSQVERLEIDADVKREEVKVLQARLDGILNDGESWRSDLEEREKRVRDLELRMEEWQQKKREASEDRARLGEINDEVHQARRSLELDMAQSKSRPDSPIEASEKVEGGIEEIAEEESLSIQLKSLQETHAATLADLTTVTAKYRDALKEISDLAGQINEIKLSSPSSRSESPERTPDTPITPKKRIGRARELSEGSVNAAGRRLFFRQAASAESLHSR